MSKKADRKRLGQHEEMLPVVLSDKELLAMGRRIGELHQEMALLASAFDLQKMTHKEKVAVLEEEKNLLVQALLTGKEPRPVAVEAWAEFTDGLFRAIRSDTKEVIQQRPLRPSERQGELSDDWTESLFTKPDVAKARAGDVEAEGDAA